MTDKDDASYYEGVQRFLSNLRCSAERRTSGDRRQRHRNVVVERRAGEDRRIYRERRQSLSNYSTEDVLDIKAMILDPGSRVACPECNGSLMLGAACFWKHSPTDADGRSDQPSITDTLATPVRSI
ncbi:MAG: hypothetical protein P8X82_05155 [Gemmatimonadales bacterium]